MTNNRRNKDKKKPLPTIAAVVMALLFFASDSTEDFLAYAVLLAIFVSVPVAVFFILRYRVKKRRSNEHTHDRINHSMDLIVHPKTGKTIRPTVRRAAHTPQEHWKMQLDGLLENGTIDKKEYRALMNRRF